MELILSYMYRGEINVEESGIGTIRILFIDADPDPDWNKNSADPHADPTLKFYTCWKIRVFFTLLFVTALPLNNFLSFYFTPLYLFHFLGIDMVPVRIGLPRMPMAIRIR
jgi:hypothetical protein